MSRKSVIIAVAIVIGGLLAGTVAYPNMNRRHMAQSHPTYSLNLISGKSYAKSKPATLRFDVKDQNGKVLRDFDTVHEKKLHFIVIRKDRTNFQHVHPVLNKSSGEFTLERFTLPADGEYRLFADFTPSNGQKDATGMKRPATPYQDVQVGDVGKYTPQPIGQDKLSSSANSLDTSIFFPPNDDGPGMTSTDFFAGQSSFIAVSVDKNGARFKSLQTYLGALGHMVVLGPKLEYIHAHVTSEDVSSQVGLITFDVTFPEAGQYKLYLQTQAAGIVNTTDYTLTVKPSPGGNTKSEATPSMNHGRH